MPHLKNYTQILLLLFVFTSCKQREYKNSTTYDSPQSGTIRIAVDESFEPVVKELIKVYENSYPNAHIIATYKPQSECFQDLQNDSIRMIIVARGLTTDEEQYYKDTLKFKPNWDIIAYTAIALISNQKHKDSIYTINKIKNILSGTDKFTTVLLDAKNATSTSQFLRDSILHNAPFGKNVFATQNSKDEIKIIIDRDDAIGFVGLSWLQYMYQQSPNNAYDKLKIAFVQSPESKDVFFAKPSQATIAQGQYPLTIPIYYILKENVNGLGTGFTNFMCLERGQLIFRRASLVPAKLNFTVRKGIISTR